MTGKFSERIGNPSDDRLRINDLKIAYGLQINYVLNSNQGQLPGDHATIVLVGGAGSVGINLLDGLAIARMLTGLAFPLPRWMHLSPKSSGDRND